MASWIGCIGPNAEHAFTEINTQQRVLGANFALATCDGNGEPACLTTEDTGCVQAAIGNSTEAGCSALITPGKPEVTLTCDPFGLHSIFTAKAGDCFWFASDFHLLRKTVGLPFLLRPEALQGYLCFSYVPTPATLHAGIDALPAGRAPTFSTRKLEGISLQEEMPWEEHQPFRMDQAEAVDELRLWLREVTARHLDEEREVGVFLSGGLDSSLVAALLAEAGARLHLFTLDFGPPYNAELPCAQAVAAHLKQPLHIVPALPEQIAKALPAAAKAMQQPFGDAVTVPLYLLGQAAVQKVRTVFNGEFGDQLFGGWANKPMVAAELYGSPDYDRTAAYMATFHRFHGLTDRLYTPQMQKMVRTEAEAWIRPALESGPFSSLLHRLRAANVLLKGTQNIAPRARQLAEAVGLKIRSPFCDRELAYFTFACPPEWFLQGACEKYLLKQAAEIYLPSEIVWREKRGMGVPVTEWCLGGLKPEMARVLSPRRIKQEGLFQLEAVQALVRGSDHPGEFRTRRLGERLWTLFMFHLWKDIHAL